VMSIHTRQRGAVASPQDDRAFAEHILGKLIALLLCKEPNRDCPAQRARPALLVSFHLREGYDLMNLCRDRTKEACGERNKGLKDAYA
jgi:hypothetical protein